MKKIYSELSGAWEERGVIGTRIEIDGDGVCILWRNSTVLETTYKAEERDGGYELVLRKTGMRYAGDAKDYAEVSGLFYNGEELVFTEDFPITGKSESRLTKTENSRYGNYTVCDEILKELAGTWKSGDGFVEAVFKGDSLTFCGERRKIHVLKPNGTGGVYEIADADPSIYEMRGFSRLEYDGSALRTRMLVCDAPSVQYILTRTEK